MGIANQVIFRRITAADFFNINRPGSETGGGKQSYIDVNTSSAPVSAWSNFLSPIQPKSMAQNRPAWDIIVHSIGLAQSQSVRVAHRRKTSVSITSQKLASKKANRVFAWRPNNGFPAAPSPALHSSSDPRISALIDGLVVYLVQDGEGQIWAGWFKRNNPVPSWNVDTRLTKMFTDPDGHILLIPPIMFDESATDWPFGSVAAHGQQPAASAIPAPVTASPPISVHVNAKAKSYPIQKDELQILDELFESDDESGGATPAIVAKYQKIRKRNSAAVKSLKALYRKCQITGDTYVFTKPNGEPYLEAHHLVPLGEGGADKPHNLVILSAHVHKMMHYATLGPIDLSQIKNEKLQIEIGSKKYMITWHKKHAEKVLAAAKTSPEAKDES